MLDLAGLQISTAEFLWTIISFFLFMFLLKKVLYEPILKIMDARAEHIKAGLEEGKNAQKALEESKAKLADELTEKSGEARQLISDARTEAEKAKARKAKEEGKKAKRGAPVPGQVKLEEVEDDGDMPF